MKSFVCLVFALLLAGCERNPAPKPVHQYQMRGEVVSLDPTSQTATVKHDKIEGWMDAMTMEYPVKPDAEFQKLHIGDKIEATVVVEDPRYYVTAIKVVTAVTEPRP